MQRMGRMKIKDLYAPIGWQYQKFRRRIKANDFRPAELMHFCSQMLVKELKQGVNDEEADTIGESGRKKSKAPCMVLFCAFEQLHYYIELGERYGFKHFIPLVFRKNFSSQVLKANMKIVGTCEYGLVLYKDKLPKFNNEGRMIFKLNL